MEAESPVHETLLHLSKNESKIHAYTPAASGSPTALNGNIQDPLCYYTKVFEQSRESS